MKNYKYAVVRTAFHNGGIVSHHNSELEAIKAMLRYGGDSLYYNCGIVAINKTTQKEFFEYCKYIATNSEKNNKIVKCCRNFYYNDEMLQLYNDLAIYNGNNNCFELCLRG